MPWRLLRLTPAGAAALARLFDGAPVATAAEAALAGRLVAAGLAHPMPVPADDAAQVVVPVRDRPEELDRTLAALTGLDVVVVDDGSTDAARVEEVAVRHRARLVRLPVNRGPAAARNAGLAATTAPVVAFVDSDCGVDAGSIRGLAAHLGWPAVGAVAPRVRPDVDALPRTLRSVARARSPHDLGPSPAGVRPGGRVPFVPATVLVVRRAAVDAVGGFDEELRFGEDVDLVWRLHDAGWQVRYDPDVVVLHREPTTWPAWLARRYRYGTSAAVLATRYPGRLSGPALAAVTAPFVVPQRTRGTLPAGVAARIGAAAAADSMVNLVRWSRPLLLPATLIGPHRLRRPLVAAITASYLAEAIRPEGRSAAAILSPVLDDAAYGVGVWRGCIRWRTAAPLLPRLAGRIPPASVSEPADLR